VLAEAGLVPGRDYPLPIVDLKASRARALAAFAKLKQAPSAAVGSGPGAG
jgi:deoxyribodipyrimidine photo-lyase